MKKSCLRTEYLDDVNDCVRSVKSYGRTKGRNFKASALENLESFRIDISYVKDAILEIGFGYGEHLLTRALESSDKLFIGAEVYLNGISKLLQMLLDGSIKNVKIYDGDVRILLEQLSSAVLERVYILFPDPWPKRSQRKRRLVNNKFLRLLFEKIKPHGDLIFASDDAGYVEEVRFAAGNLGLCIEGFTLDKNMTRYASKATQLIGSCRIYR